MATPTERPCPGLCTEGAMCPACFRAWQLADSARSLREWLTGFGTQPDAQAPARPSLRLVRG